MFSKSLFKQSCKANGMMWTVITFAVCFMLCCVMLIAGGGELGNTKKVIEEAVIQGELESQTQSRAISYYETANGALTVFDNGFAAALSAGQNRTEAYKSAVGAVNAHYLTLLKEQGYTEESTEGQELKGLIFYTLNPLQADGTYMFDAFYAAQGEPAPRYETVLATLGQPSHNEDREEYVFTNITVFLSGNMVKDENIDTVLEALKDYGVTREEYHEFGYDDYAFVKGVACDVLVNYRANLAYRIENIKDGETVESIKAELIKNLSGGLLASLPEDVSAALEEIGAADLYGTLVGSIFFKMAGLLLPIIYMIMASNALIAGQVDSGSMAYILSSGTKRKEVLCTQALFLIGSIFAMFLCTTLTSIVCLAIVNVETGLTYGKLVLINLGAFLVMFAMSGICFLGSCVFNRSKHSMALGGGLNMFFLVATMLGLFGSPVLPSIIRMKALNAFNYVTIISLFDVVSILEGTLTFLWKLSILIVIGVACYVAGSVRFRKKDLPL